MKGGGKTSYEIRADLLQLAFDILSAQADQERAMAALTHNPTNVTPPTTDAVIAEATKLNRFVSNDRNL